jgi:hypothetical protein
VAAGGDWVDVVEAQRVEPQDLAVHLASAARAISGSTAAVVGIWNVPPGFRRFVARVASSLHAINASDVVAAPHNDMIGSPVTRRPRHLPTATTLPRADASAFSTTASLEARRGREPSH